MRRVIRYKKAEITLETLIKLVLGLLAVGILAYLLWVNVNKSDSDVKSIKDDANDKISDSFKICEIPGTGRKCQSDCPSTASQADCPSGQKCCKLTS